MDPPRGRNRRGPRDGGAQRRSQELVLNLAEIASEAEEIANAPPPDPNMTTGEIAGPDAESVR